MISTKIKLKNESDIIRLCQIIGLQDDNYYLQNAEDNEIVNAASIMGCVYAAAHFPSILLYSQTADKIPDEMSDFIDEVK